MPEAEQSYHVSSVRRRSDSAQTELTADEESQLEYEKEINNAKAKQRQSLFSKMGKFKRMFGLSAGSESTDRAAMYSAEAEYGLLDS